MVGTGKTQTVGGFRATGCQSGLNEMKTNTFIMALAIGTFLSSVTAASPAEAGGAVQVYLTAKDTGQRLTRVADLDFAPLPQPTEHQQCVFVDRAAKFQTVLGIGGALT